MRAYKDFIDDIKPYRSDIYDYYSLFVESLFVRPEFRKQGVGKALINIAKQESYLEGCSGNVHLIAGKVKGETTFPQIFYRKQGFETQRKGDMEIIDKSIEKGKELPSKMSFALGTPMYFKPQKLYPQAQFQSRQ